MKSTVFNATGMAAPRPEKKPKSLEGAHGDLRTDPYYWLNERENPSVVEYLERENQYAETILSPVKDLQERLFEEMKARIKEDDNSVPYYNNGFWYYTRFETGKEYPIYCRKHGALSTEEQVILDVNNLAAGKSYCNVTGLQVSPNGKYLFFATDYTGRNLYEARIKDLEANLVLDDKFDSAFGASAWSKDSKYVFYDTKDETTLRTDKIWRHEVGTNGDQDTMVYEDTDETVYLGVSSSKDGEYIFVTHGYTQNLETRYLKSDNPLGSFQLIHPRSQDFFYDVEHYNGHFIIRTNAEGRNFCIMKASVIEPQRNNWKPLLPHRTDALVEYIDVYRDFMAISERTGGLQQINIYRWSDGSTHYIDFGEPTYQASPIPLPDPNASHLRYAFSSLKTPPSVFEYEVETKIKTLKKEEPVLGGFDALQYKTELLWATARDGIKVPVSVVYKKDIALDGSAPCFQIGYGSYGVSYDPAFNKQWISLLDRGFVGAIAHIRGGMEMGFHWYEQGKMLHKMNTFHDFIDCSEMLIEEKYTASDRLFAQGGSAGGLLMGAIANMRPDLYCGIIASVPFVDVLTTMSDPSIPLTTGEYTEWGNPSVPEQYAYMKQYSPYDNVKKQAYPHLLVKTSFADSQVQYFEPAKWVARLRDNKTDNNLLLFITNMSGSHGGSSGRFERLKERALEYAWMIGTIGDRFFLPR